MKNFKIVNLFIFLFVINLSITFLYKNNLFATFINGVLQTDDKNLWQGKQRSLAEAGTSYESQVSSHLSPNVVDHITSYCDDQHLLTNRWLSSLKYKSTEQRRQYISDMTNFNREFFLQMGKRYEPVPGEVENSYNRLMTLMKLINLEGDLTDKFPLILGNVKQEHMYVNLIISKFFKDNGMHTSNTLDYNFVRYYIKNNLNVSDSKCLVISLDDLSHNVYKMCICTMDRLKKDDIIP